MITTITKLLNPSGQILSVITGVSYVEMPLVCGQCPDPKHTGWAAMGKHCHSSSSSEICKHGTLTETCLHEWVSQTPGVWPCYPIHKKQKQTLAGFQGSHLGRKVWFTIILSMFASVGRAALQSHAAQWALVMVLPGSPWEKMWGKLYQ